MRVRDVVRMLSKMAGVRWSGAAAIASFVIRPSSDGSPSRASPAKNSRPVRRAAFCDRLVCRRRPVEHLDRGVRANCDRMDISEAIALHVQALAEEGLPIPDPHSVDVGQVELRQLA